MDMQVYIGIIMIRNLLSHLKHLFVLSCSTHSKYFYQKTKASFKNQSLLLHYDCHSIANFLFFI
jgi:hypothetical protein